MYNTFCIAALMGAVASAKIDKTARFIDWASKHNKHYDSVKEYNMRLYIFEENSATVDEMNERFNDRGVFFEDNKFSDLSKEEQTSGLVIEPQHGGRNLHTESHVAQTGADKGRMLKGEDPIDWFADG